jgi:hypothetical protein
LNVTESAPPKFVPVMETDVPTEPAVGVNEEIVGAQLPGFETVKFVLVAVPDVFTTWIGPVVAPFGTVARICVLVTEATLAWVPLKSTLLTRGLVKFVPVMVTTHPAGPLEGENDVIVGTAASAGSTIVARRTNVTDPVPASSRARRLAEPRMATYLPIDRIEGSLLRPPYPFTGVSLKGHRSSST